MEALSLASWLPTLFAENSTSAVTAVSSFLTRKLESQAGVRNSPPLEKTSLEQLAAVCVLNICCSLFHSSQLYSKFLPLFQAICLHNRQLLCAWCPSTLHLPLIHCVPVQFRSPVYRKDIPGILQQHVCLQVLTQIAPSLATSEKLHLHPVLTNAVQADPTSPLQALLGLVQVQWPPGTDEKADQLFNQLYEYAEEPPHSLTLHTSSSRRHTNLNSL